MGNVRLVELTPSIQLPNSSVFATLDSSTSALNAQPAILELDTMEQIVFASLDIMVPETNATNAMLPAQSAQDQKPINARLALMFP